MTDAALIIPGVVQVAASSSGRATGAIVQLGSAVGWTMSRGVHTWSRELSVVVKETLTPQLLKELGLVLPEQQGDPEVIPRARRAAQACRLVAVERPVLEKLQAKGLRVHTVGFDRVSNGFFYISSEGNRVARRIQGELIEMIAAGMEQPGTNEALEDRLDGLIDRLVAQLSDGVLSEAELELAEALPPLGPSSGTAAAKLQVLEGWLILAASRSSKTETDAKKLAETLRGAARSGVEVVEVPLFGEARRVTQPELEIEFVDGDAGVRSRTKLPARTRWLVANRSTASVPPPVQAAAPARAPVDGRAAAPDKVVAPRPAAEARAASDARAAAQRAAADKAAADKAAAERAASERAAADKAAAERAAAERAAADKAAAERSAVERAAEKAAAERAATERAATERAAAERAAAERTAAERAATERAAAERAAAERAAAERAAEQVAAERAAAERAVAERAAAERAATEKAAARAAMEARPAAREASASTETKSIEPAKDKRVAWRRVQFFVWWLFVGAVIGAVLRYLKL